MAGIPAAALKGLCGDENLKNIVLVTTMWDELQDGSIGSKREEKLLSTHWKDMIHLGLRTCRFQGTHESAWEIIGCLDLEGCHQTRTPLRIQREMVDRSLPFYETAAAKILNSPASPGPSLGSELKNVWEGLRHGVRGKVGARVPSRRPALSRSPTIGSGSSATGWSVLSTSSSTNSSYHSPQQTLSPTESTSSGCGAYDRRETLLAMITGLRLAHQMADIAAIPVLRGTIGTVLEIAQMIEVSFSTMDSGASFLKLFKGMGGTHHAISEVAEYSGWLLEEIAQYTEGTKLPKELKKTLKTFQKYVTSDRYLSAVFLRSFRELRNLQNVVKKISTRTPIIRFILSDADMQAITACTAVVRAVYDKLEVRPSLVPGLSFLTMQNRSGSPWTIFRLPRVSRNG